MDYFFNENNVKLKFKHEFRLLGKSGYLFGYAVFPDSPIIGLQKRKHKKIRVASILAIRRPLANHSNLGVFFTIQ